MEKLVLQVTFAIPHISTSSYMWSFKLGSTLVARHRVGIVSIIGIRIYKPSYFGKAGERFKYLLFRRIPEIADIITLLKK